MNKMFKKALAVLLAVFMVAGFVPFVDLELPTASADTWGGGSSSSGLTLSGNSYYINNANGFEYFAQTVRNGTDYSGKTVYLNTDINMDNRAFSGIGVVNKYFRGTFDGQNYTISNLKINISDDRVGLFRNTENATIKNLKINAANITGSKRGTATIVGYATGNLNISGITVTGGTVTGGWKDGNTFSGGLIGECPALLSMNSCRYNGNVTSNGGDNLGGLVGIAGADGTTISNSSFGLSSSSNGTLSLKGRNVGGIVGCFSTDKTININNCQVYASSITAIRDYAGGVIGKSFGTTKISGCTVNVQANGYISAGEGDAGGIIGWLEDDNSSITNSSVKANVKAGRECGGALGFFGGDRTVTVSNFTFNGSVYSAADECRSGGVIGHTNGFLVLSDIVVKGGPIVSARSDAGGDRKSVV